MLKLYESPLSAQTQQALDWYFNSHSEETITAVRDRLGCIFQCLNETRDTNRFGCHPDYSALAYVCVDSTPICTQVRTNVCYTNQHFGGSDRTRAETSIHECAHRVGLSLGTPESVPDIYDHTARFMFLDTDDALQNADSFALFAGAVNEGVPLSIVGPIFGSGFGFAAPGSGSPTWQARLLYYGVEFQHPVLGFFNPTLGIGLSIIGETESGTGPTSVSSPSSMLVSLLPGVRIGDPRPGAAGSGYVSLFGGPALSVGSEIGIGSEAGASLGYRWRWLDVSVGIGHIYDPSREADMENLFTGSINMAFTPFNVNLP
jgi:hypothetical protein